MTDYTKLVEALRHCSHDGLVNCNECKYGGTEWPIGCEEEMMADAAAAIEALNRLVDLNTERCEGLRQQLRKAHESYEKHLNEQEQQLPKRGEWKTTDAFPHRVYCSKCFKTYVPNDRWQIWVDNELPRNYCPNCGADMRKMEVQE